MLAKRLEKGDYVSWSSEAETEHVAMHEGSALSKPGTVDSTGRIDAKI